VPREMQRGEGKTLVDKEDGQLGTNDLYDGSLVGMSVRSQS
jgi:hypothetical protein